MEDERKAKKQLISEVVEMRQLVAALNTTETECRQARAALQESEARFRNLLDYVPGVSIQEYTADGIVRYWNKASEQVYGYTAEEAIGRNLGDLIIPPEVKPQFKQGLELGAKCTKSGELMPPGELMLLHKNGSLVPVYSIHTVVCLSGRPPLMFCIDVDLSERKRTEEALRKAHNELERRVEERTAELAKVNDKLRREIEKRKLVEEALEQRIFALTQPEVELGGIKFTDIIGIEILQKLQDNFAERNKVASIIFNNTGEPITAYSNFSEFCMIIRSTPKGLENCKKSDARLGEKAAHGNTGVVPCGNIREIMDGVVPIIIQDRHIANWGIGQAVTGDINEDEIREFAREIGADEEKLIKASKKLVRMSKEQFGGNMRFLDTMARQVSLLGLQNLQQARLISERKRAEEALRESERRYFLATSAGRVGVWDWNLDTNEIYLDPMLKAFLGYENHEIRNHIDDWGERVHPADQERVMAEATKYLEGASLHYETEHRMLHKDGSIRWFLARGTAMRDKSGKPYRMLGTDTDITEHKQAAETLKKSETRLAEAQHTAHLGGWEWDIVKHEVHWSAELYRIFDVDPDEFKPSKAAFLERVHPDDRPYLEECIAAILSNKEPFSVDHRITLPSGTIRYLHSEARMECDAANRPVRLVGISQDVTKQKQADEALRKSYTEIEQLKDRLQAESEYLRAEIKLTHSHSEIVGESEAINKVFLQVEQVAPTESLVLITGETGTGKELVARAIHNLGKRKDRVMVKVDCASLPSALVESELFGREKGAYTGALTSQVGRFEVADGSSIFLDEIGELSPELQAKLLRVIQEGEFERLGSPKTIRVNVRVIAATNRDLSAEVRKGNFREDLYYRLNVFHIEVPPLRERLDDIPLLVWTFVNEFAEKMGKKIQTVSKKTMESLQRYHWPGNVRELRNVIEHAVIISTSDILKVKLPQDPRGVTSRILTLEDAERQHITKVLDRTNWRIKGPHGAAELLGLKPSTLYTKMNKLGIPTSRNKDAIPT